MAPVTTYQVAPPDSEATAPFRATPWALEYFTNPKLHVLDNESRVFKHPTTSDTFVGKTLATEDTIRGWQSYWRPPNEENKFGEVLSLLSLGSGVNGHTDTAHGGFVSLLLDEALGMAAGQHCPDSKSTMTAYLKVDYKKPVKTPAVVLCRAFVEKVEGKKLWIRGSIEDGQGTVLSTGEALFILVEKLEARSLL